MSETVTFKKGDWVKLEGSPELDGLVVRAAKNGRWVDVRWRRYADAMWTKRMKNPALLRLTGTIQRGDLTITELADG